MKAITKYVEGGMMDPGYPSEKEVGLADRLLKIRGTYAPGFLSLAADVDFDNLSGLDDEQLGALYDMAQKYKTMFKGKGDGASGVMGKLKDNYSMLAEDLDKAAEITGMDRDEIKDIGYDIIDANPGDKMNFVTRGGAKALLYSLDQGGKVKEEEDEGQQLDVDLLKKGIAYAESLDGKLMMNPNSSATGLYGQLYNEIKDLDFMKGVSREQFAKNRKLQEKVFDMRVNEGINAPSLRRNAIDLTKEYMPKLGDDWNFSLDDVAAISNYLGRQGAREYFASLVDGTAYEVGGVNKSVQEYLDKYHAGRGDFDYYTGGKIKPVKTAKSGMSFY